MSLQILRNLTTRAAASLACAVTATVIATAAQAESCRFDDLANATFTENRPGNETAQMLREELLSLGPSPH